MTLNTDKHGRRWHQRAFLSALAESGSTLLNGLVSWWDLDEESGTRADAVGSNDLTDTNTVGYESGKIGNAAWFTRANSERLLRDSVDIDVSNGFSISCWLKIPDVTATTFKCWAHKGAGTQEIQFDIYQNTIRCIIFDSVSGNALTQHSNQLTNETWAHVVASYDPSTKKITSVVNNADEKTSSALNNSLRWATSRFEIGSANGGSFFDGEIDQFGFWNRVLTSDERTELYNSGASIKNPFTDNGEGFRQGMVSYWTLDEESGTRADSVGSNSLTDNNTVGYAAGVSGNAADLELDNSEYLSVASPIDSAQDWTVCGWFKPESVGAYHMLFMKDNTSGTREWTLQMDAGVAHLYIFDSAAGSADVSVSTGAMSAGTWYFVAARYLASDKKGRVSVDAGTVATTAALTNGLPTTTNPFWIGRRDDGYNWDGLVDEVSLYQRYLSDDEIAALYASGSGRFYDFNTL